MTGAPTYPCDMCGGIGFTGRNLTVPCRTCGTTGERTAPRPQPRRAPLLRTGTSYPDPWINPDAASELAPPPF